MAYKYRMEKIFESIRDAAGDTDRSYQWYIANIKKLAGNIRSPSAAYRTDLGELTSVLEPGNLYMYMYDPKYKKKLPYYDTFPLCLPFKEEKGGFTGLNLHYLPPMLRAQLFGKLLEYTDTPTLMEDTKIMARWQLLENYSKFPETVPTVKRYLYNNVKSRFLKINPQHWKASIFLPLANFEKASDQMVWRESRDML